MREKSLRKSVNKTLRLCVSAVVILFCFCITQAQSTNQSFPTPVTTNEINGKIPARDVGDARLTNYFYVFNGNQGDVFINVVTKNFDGDIDVFTLNGLRPLTKITVYSDSSDNETGRIVYLRQPEKLLLRIEGRTPNDDAATFRIKFAGSFEPMKAVAENEDEELPEVKAQNEGEVRVNSVGTIIETKPKPTPQAKEKAAEKEEESETVAETKEEKKDEKSDKKKPVIEKKDEEKEVAEQKEEKEEKKEEESDKEKETAKKSKKPIVVITDTLPKDEEKKAEKEEDETAAKTEAETKKKKEKKPKKPDPLENIKLIVLFKDGTKIERPISEVVRVSVDKGILTIITKDGLISRYSILDVEEMTIK